MANILWTSDLRRILRILHSWPDVIYIRISATMQPQTTKAQYVCVRHSQCQQQVPFGWLDITDFTAAHSSPINPVCSCVNWAVLVGNKGVSGSSSTQLNTFSLLVPDMSFSIKIQYFLDMSRVVTATTAQSGHDCVLIVYPEHNVYDVLHMSKLLNFSQGYVNRTFYDRLPFLTALLIMSHTHDDRKHIMFRAEDCVLTCNINK